MKCLNCGKESNHYLCDACAKPDILDRIFNEIRSYKPETCTNPYLAEFASGLTEKYAERDIIPEILELFDPEITDYYYCRYYKMSKENKYRFEEAALDYLNKHELMDIHSQTVLYELLQYYNPNDFVKPKKWCESIGETDGLCCELYAEAAKYYAMTGEYDMADALTEKGAERLDVSGTDALILYSPEGMNIRLEKQRTDTLKYRSKPYWPNTEERRRVIAMFYDEKGIKYPRIESKPKKVSESEFATLNEYVGDELNDYCAFWCSEAYSAVSSKSIYQIGAAKVKGGEIVDTFESFIRPWGTSPSARKTAAKEAGVPLEVIESAEDVDLVMLKFFEFVDNDVLVSTGALGNQAKLISRAARYVGMKEIPNEFYDILDLAADTSPDFDLANNTREYLLGAFSIAEGKTAQEKAMVNKQLYEALLNYGE